MKSKHKTQKIIVKKTLSIFIALFLIVSIVSCVSKDTKALLIGEPDHVMIGELIYYPAGAIIKAMDNLRRHIPQDAKVSLSDINTPNKKLKNIINKEIELYLKKGDYMFVKSRSDFRITGRVEGEGENKDLHLQLINTKTGNIVDSTTVLIDKRKRRSINERRNVLE